MTKRLVGGSIRAVLLLLVVAIPGLAGPVNLSLKANVSGSDFIFRFITDQNPTPDDYLPGVGFVVIGPGTISYQGDSVTAEMQLALVTDLDLLGAGETGPGGAIIFGGSLLFASEEILYTGPEAAPTLKLGTFPVLLFADFGSTAVQGGVPGVYTATVTPEPGAFSLTAAGILALGAALRLVRKR